MLALELLRYAASGPASSARMPSPQVADEREVQWVLDAGWGALAHLAARNGALNLPPARRDSLLSAELTARVACGSRVDSALELIDLCRTTRTEVTLLKGISISEQCYPEEHLRPMGDIDVLIPSHAYTAVEAALLHAGYLRDPDWPPGLALHHGAPLFHPDRQVWVELHTALFPDDDSLRSDGVFSPLNVASESVASSFHARPVKRLSHELQLVYTAASLMRDLMHHRIHPSHLNTLLDVVVLLRVARHTLNWESLFRWLDNPMATIYLYATLAYVARRGLGPVSPEILARLDAKQNLVGAIQLKFIHAMLDRYLVGGRPWSHVLPPPVPGRYSLRYQLSKRLAPAFRRR